MRNIFKNKKANRFRRGYQPSKEERREAFDKLLQQKVSQRMRSELGEGKGIDDFFKYREQNGERILKEEKEKLIKEIGGRDNAIEFMRKEGQSVLLKKIKGGKR